MDNLALIGIGGALLAAVGQAGSYLVSREYLSAPGRSPLQLLILSNFWLAIISLPILLLTWRVPPEGWGMMLAGAAMTVCSYLAAQSIFFWTVRVVPASRIAPLLGVKIIFVALLALLLGNAELGAGQWLAVGLTLVAAVAIQKAAEPVPVRGLIGIISTGAFFACSDNGIALMNRSLGPASEGLGAPMFVLAVTHVALLPCAGIGALVLRRGKEALPWRASVPYALIWFGSMVTLYIGIVYAGVVLAIICQAMRGPFSLFIALAVARLGWHHLEVPQGRKTFLKQVAAALLMTAAIALYVLF